MTDASIDALRGQLRERGYLTHRIEQWFALDPWSSRTFWVELLTVAAKAATLTGVFASLACVAVMLSRNQPLTIVETLELFLTYAVAAGLAAFVLIALTALILKVRPQLPIDTPGALLGISISTSAILTGLFIVWWYGFDTKPGTIELIAGGALATLSFVVTTIVASAALLSFSIYEVHRLPAIHQRSRTAPLSAAAAALIALLFVPAYAIQDRKEQAPGQIVTTPTQRRLALLAVDGLTYEITSSRPDIAAQFDTLKAVATVPGASTTERWASIGTGVPALLHGVRAVDGVRFRGGRHVLQSVSGADVVLRVIAPDIGLTRREPLPPTVRKREYVWEIFAARGVPSVAVNWWTSESVRSGALTSVGQESIFAAGRGDALLVDSTAVRRFLDAIDEHHPQFATVYLPALDVVLNRLHSDQSRQLALSLRALDGVATAIKAVRARGYEVILIGLPGESESGHAVLGASFAFSQPSSAYDVAPTVVELIGFPPSKEMPGQSISGAPHATRIATYGGRARSEAPVKLNEEYYESLRALGYIR